MLDKASVFLRDMQDMFQIIRFRFTRKNFISCIEKINYVIYNKKKNKFFKLYKTPKFYNINR